MRCWVTLLHCVCVATLVVMDTQLVHSISATRMIPFVLSSHEQTEIQNYRVFSVMRIQNTEVNQIHIWYSAAKENVQYQHVLSLENSQHTGENVQSVRDVSACSSITEKHVALFILTQLLFRKLVTWSTPFMESSCHAALSFMNTPVVRGIVYWVCSICACGWPPAQWRHFAPGRSQLFRLTRLAAMRRS